jgi:hypothetical protein
MFSNLHNLFLLATKLHLFAWVYLLLLHSWNKLDVWDKPTLGFKFLKEDLTLFQWRVIG